MSNRRKSSPSPSNNPLGEAVICPICYEMFEGRIMMCSSGHAVCERCQKMMNECPQCRGKYTGTRNYQMEHVVQTLKTLQLKKNLEPDAAETTKTDEVGDKKNTKKKKNTNEAPSSSTVSASTTAGQTIIGNSVVSNVIPTAASIVARKIPQIKGSHICCEFVNCDAKLPICRIYNHIRYYHKDLYTEVKVNTLSEHPSATCVFNVLCRTYRHAIKITEYGLFFLKVNVKKAYGDVTINAWVQGTCGNREARHFKYDLEIQVGKAVAKYSDLCYGYNQKDTYVEHTLHCLNLSTNVNVKMMNIRLKMYRWFGNGGLPRNSNTVITAAQPPNVPPTNAAASQPNSNNMTGSSGARRNRRKNRRH